MKLDTHSQSQRYAGKIYLKRVVGSAVTKFKGVVDPLLNGQADAADIMFRKLYTPRAFFGSQYGKRKILWICGEAQ